VVCAVLVAHDHDDGHPPVRDQPSRLVGLGQEGVHPFEHPLADAGRLPEPDRRPKHQDVGREDLLPEARPLVAVAQVRLNARRDVVVGDPADGPVDAEPRELRHDLRQQELATRRGG
jgi:hypothetical protein